MDIVFIDSTAVVSSGPGSPAYFSRFAIRRLAEAGHRVIIANGFDANLCSDADVVVCEWANEPAYEAAASGVCEKLVIRVRGFDAHGPLDKLAWENVHAIVYESKFLEDFVSAQLMTIGEPGCTPYETVPAYILASGIDLARINYLRRNDDVGPVVALVARLTSDKGYQLAFEWARQNPTIRLHVTTALSEAAPRLLAYLNHAKPNNVIIHGTVDTPKWLNEIVATHILSCSIWETLGYTIAEGMAVGCRPLIHNAPGTSVNWPEKHLWTSLDELTKLVHQPVDSDEYRAYAEENFDERKLSAKFIELLETT